MLVVVVDARVVTGVVVARLVVFMLILDLEPAKEFASPSLRNICIFTKHLLLFEAVSVWVIVCGLILA